MLNVCHYYRDSEQMFAVAVLNNRREYWFDGFSISTAKLNPQNGYYGFYWMFECFENEQAVRVTDRHAKVEYVAYLWYSRSDALCCQSGLVDIYYNQVLQLRSVRSFQQLLLLYNTSHALIECTIKIRQAVIPSWSCEIKLHAKLEQYQKNFQIH